MQRRNPHQRNLRRHRVSEPGLCYFITTNVNDALPVFARGECALVVIESLRWLAAQDRLVLAGYVVMPDHLHFAMLLSHGQTLGGLMDSLKTHTAREVNKLLGRQGALWQAQYYDHVVRNVQSYAARLDYMHVNPVRKGLVQQPEDYLFSTAHPANQADIDWQTLNVHLPP